MFYTNVAQRGQDILYIGFDSNGRRTQRRIKYGPTLYVPAKKASDWKTLDGQPVEPIKFDSTSDAKDFVDKYRDVSNFSVYGLTNWRYAFIADTFPGEVKYDPSLISTLFLDIEVEVPESGFENFVEEARMPITAITIRKNKYILTFGTKPYTPKLPNTRYVHCTDEYNMLLKFMSVYTSEQWRPDVITGWNVEFFDVPYIHNRIINVLGKDVAKQLSPWGILFEKSVYSFGREQQSFIPMGVSILDYLQLYKKFTYTQQESYKLDHISYVELAEKKVDYSEHANLNELYEKDFEKYIDYNIHDVNLVAQLDEKLKLLDLIYTMAYDAKINYTDALGSVLPWEIVIYNYLKERKQVMPLKHRSGDKDAAYTGAYVKEPILGLHDWVASFDLTSLYPHLIIQYNISPETYVGKRTGVTVDSILEKRLENDGKYCIAANGCQYDRNRIGFLPALMKRFFEKRKIYKGKMLEYKKRKQQGEDVGNEVAKYHNAQMAMKIFLNSAYGAIGNQYFAFYDMDNAEAITLSGQLSIRWVERHINNFLNEKLGTNEDYIIAMDTDSLYLRLGGLVDRLIVPSVDRDLPDSVSTVVRNNLITDKLDAFCERIIQPQIEKAYQELADYLNVYENAMEMKRETIASSAIWKAKKMYVLNQIDNEGVRFKKPELKIMGIEAVRSSVPEVCRQALKKSFEIIMNEDEAALIKYVAEFRKDFNVMPFSDIAFPRGVKGINKYRDIKSIYKKGTPIHTKAALLYNSMLKKHNLNMTPIYDGDKIKYAYLKMPNPLHDTVIACPGYLPREFDLDQYVDRDLQFEKSFLGPLQSITDIIGWKTEETISIEEFF